MVKLAKHPRRGNRKSGGGGGGGGGGALPLWESVGMRRGFAPPPPPPHFRHLDDLFAPPKFDHVHHFIQILLGPISKPPNFQQVDDIFAPKIDQIYNFIQIFRSRPPAVR